MAVEFFEKFDGVKALMSIRQDGNLRILRDEFDEIIPNIRRSLFLEQWLIPQSRLFSAVLEHGNHVHTVNGYSGSFITCDGLVTNIRGNFLAITVADCLPILFYDPENEVIGIAHAGWKGLVAGIITNTVKAMTDIGADRGNIIAAIGPGACPQKYEFDLKDVSSLGEWSKPRHIVRLDSKTKKVYLDLKRIATDQLNREGLNRVSVSGECTICDEKKYFSARRDKVTPIQAMMVVIGMV